MNRRGILRIAAAFVALGVGAPVLLSASGCDKKRDQISRLIAEPNNFRDKDVQVAGRVTQVIDPSKGILTFALYQVDDGTGKAWVLSKRGAPGVGQEVGLKGRLRSDLTSLPINLNLTGILLDEVDRRTR
jgi:hypothetical protein